MFNRLTFTFKRTTPLKMTPIAKHLSRAWKKLSGRFSTFLQKKHASSSENTANNLASPETKAPVTQRTDSGHEETTFEAAKPTTSSHLTPLTVAEQKRRETLVSSEEKKEKARRVPGRKRRALGPFQLTGYDIKVLEGRVRPQVHHAPCQYATSKLIYSILDYSYRSNLSSRYA